LGGGPVEFHPEPFKIVVVDRSGRRMVYTDDYEVTMPMTERMRELLAEGRC